MRLTSPATLNQKDEKKSKIDSKSPLNLIILRPTLTLSRTQSSHLLGTCRGLDLAGERSLTPTLSESKKAVSFSDPLEEVFIVESFKTQKLHTRSAEK